MLLGRRAVGVAAIAKNSILEIVKPSSPACAARLGAPLAMAECKRKRANVRRNKNGQSIYRKVILSSKSMIHIDSPPDRLLMIRFAYLPGSFHYIRPRQTALGG